MDELMAETAVDSFADIASELSGKTVESLHDPSDFYELAVKFTDGSRLLVFSAEDGIGYCFKRADGSIVETEPGADLTW
jgi:hypothetical protein